MNSMIAEPTHIYKLFLYPYKGNLQISEEGMVTRSLMFPVINPMYLRAFLDFRTQYSEEIYSRETLSLLQAILGGEGARITTICRPEDRVQRGDYSNNYPVFDDIDIEIVQIATQECLTTGRPLVLPESLQWRYEFTLFFGLLFSRYETMTITTVGAGDGTGNFQRILWELMRFPLEKLDYYSWDSLCAGRGWTIFMMHQALDSVSDGSWTGGDNWNWGTFLINDLDDAKALITTNGTWWLTSTGFKVVAGYSYDNFVSRSSFAKIMEKQCGLIRLGDNRYIFKSLNYPIGA